MKHNSPSLQPVHGSAGFRDCARHFYGTNPKLLSKIGVWIAAPSSRTMGAVKRTAHSDRDLLGRDDGVRIMCPPKLPADDSLPPEDLARVIAACDRFEANWKAGRPRRIEDELASACEPKPARLFRELLALEVELMRRDGRHAGPDSYLSRFPGQAATVREVFAGYTVTMPHPDETVPVMTTEAAPSPEGYELVRKIGEGGQATTYLARDRALQRLVVLKRYHGVVSPGRREAVLNEGRALAGCVARSSRRATEWRVGAMRST